MSLNDPALIPDPYCVNMSEDPSGPAERARLNVDPTHRITARSSPLCAHVSQGLAVTVGSALGSFQPSREQCLAAFLVHNKAGLSAGAKAWSKHSHRSEPEPAQPADSEPLTEPVIEKLDDPVRGKKVKKKKIVLEGWWGKPSGPVASINSRALLLFNKIMDHATWRNLHWLPHSILIYEVRVAEGYGMRWSQDQNPREGLDHASAEEPEEPGQKLWLFRGLVEPMMENGHEVGWRHPV